MSPALAGGFFTTRTHINMYVVRNSDFLFRAVSPNLANNWNYLRPTLEMWIPKLHLRLTKSEYPEGNIFLFSHSVMSNSLQLHGLQHARFPCPSPSPGNCSNSCPLSQWCHPTISSSVIPFSSCLQSFPVSGSFPVSALHIRWPKYWTFSFISPLINIQGWFPLRLTVLISL